MSRHAIPEADRHPRLLVRNAEVDGKRVDVLVEDGVVAAIGTRLRAPRGAGVLDAGGGALLPGLSDHHIHLTALAADARSLHLGPPEVCDATMLTRALSTAHERAPTGASIRATGYHPAVAGPLDRWRLDEIAPGRPVRVQHRSGAMWVLSSAALDTLDLTDPPPGLELDAARAPTGRLIGLDHWLRSRLPVSEAAPDLFDVAQRLHRYGVTAVTDMTATEDVRDFELLGDAVRDGLALRVTVTGGPGLAHVDPSPLRRGPVKIVVGDHALPTPEDLVGRFRCARASRLPVAVHCVTRTALVLALVAWDEVGAVRGDRVEHGAVVPPDLAHRLSSLGVTVVTQPNFVHERGDEYLDEVEPMDLEWIYPCASLLRAGVAVGIGTDAPFGHPDPWRAIAAAATRRTRRGRPLGPDELVTAERALEMLLSDGANPGGSPRRVAIGAPADLCLLDVPLASGLDRPSADHVRCTLFAGGLVYDRDAAGMP